MHVPFEVGFPFSKSDSSVEYYIEGTEEMAGNFKPGDKACIVGLVNRQDLNGQTVKLSSWKRDLGRWSAYCDTTKEGIQVRPVNLRLVVDQNRKQEKTGRKYLIDPMLASALRTTVRGGAFPDHTDKVPGMSGQITRLAFEEFTKLLMKVYTDPSSGTRDKETAVVEMLLDFIGEESDVTLLFRDLKQRMKAAVDSAFKGFFIPLPSTLTEQLKMNTANGIFNLIINARKGTLAYIESRQGLLLNRVIGKELKIASNREDPSTFRRLMFVGGVSDNKSITKASIKQELIDAALCGEVTVIGKEGYKTVEIIEPLHRGYVDWLIEDGCLWRKRRTTKSTPRKHRTMKSRNEIFVRAVLVVRVFLLFTSAGSHSWSPVRAVVSFIFLDFAIYSFSDRLRTYRSYWFNHFSI